MYNYRELKKKKLIQLKTDEKEYYLSVAKFDVGTGERKVPTCYSLSKSHLEKVKVDLEKRVKDIEAILKDMKLLEEKEK